jgi:hypothetical protein
MITTARNRRCPPSDGRVFSPPGAGFIVKIPPPEGFHRKMERLLRESMVLDTQMIQLVKDNAR